MMYGAKGDGITDDTTAFLNALSYITSSSNRDRAMILYIPKGTYFISQTLNFGPYSNKTTVRGDISGTILLWSKDAHLFQFGISNDLSILDIRVISVTTTKSPSSWAVTIDGEAENCYISRLSLLQHPDYFANGTMWAIGSGIRFGTTSWYSGVDDLRVRPCGYCSSIQLGSSDVCWSSPSYGRLQKVFRRVAQGPSAATTRVWGYTLMGA
eukprot:TRINITY_DN4142_c0_g2_i1.p2 TRINITY_DN4142_c0_g2~~TRINITY_DN4142_c0_g2_i1.p2  ORF type:complete len:211 (-),score=23.44 TRINITY_DN4142_c0_g2_i1:538-1170(-)